MAPSVSDTVHLFSQPPTYHTLVTTGEIDERQLEKLADWVLEAKSVLFITGAGLSADSGLPTYRGVGGLYDEADTEDGVPIEVALSGGMFAQRPELTWKHIRRIEEACRGAGPNDAHRAMAAIERVVPRTWVLTQNVDGLHDAAGSTNVIAIHGDVHLLECTRCRWHDEVEDYAGLASGLPTCPACDAVIRPRVVLFDEMLPVEALDQLQLQLAHGFDVVFSGGTSSLFPYIAQPVVLAARTGGRGVEINPGRTPVSDIVDLRLETGAAAAMRGLMVALQARGVDVDFAPSS